MILIPKIEFRMENSLKLDHIIVQITLMQGNELDNNKRVITISLEDHVQEIKDV